MDIEQTTEMVYDLIIATLKANAPKDTGNLALNSIRRVEEGIVIGGEIAPYAQKTEEYNRSSKGWIKNTLESLQPTIQSIYQGLLSQEEIQNLINIENTSTLDQFIEIANRKGGG